MQKRKWLTVCLFIFSLLSALAQTPYYWAKQFPGNGWAYPTKMLLDENKNIYVCGTFSLTTDFDPGPGTNLLTAKGMDDGFLMKLDSNGSFLWVKQFSGAWINGCSTMRMDRDGDLWIAGFFYSTVDVDPGPDSIIYQGGYTNYLCKYDRDGKFITGIPPLGYSLSSFEIGKDNEIYLTGSFFDTTDFDPGPSKALGYAKSIDAYLCKFNSSGGFVWAKTFGGNSVDYSNDIAIDSKGNIFLTGNFRDTTDLDPGPATQTACANQNVNDDIFILKLDQDGNFTWKKTYGLFLSDIGMSINVDSEDNIYCSGTFLCWVDFDDGPRNYVLTADDDADIFLMKLDAAGEFQWAKGIRPSIWYDLPRDMVIDEELNVYLSGYIQSECNFDIMSKNFSLITEGGYDAYVCEYGRDGSNKCVSRFGGPFTDQCWALAVDRDFNIYTAGLFNGSANFSSVPSEIVLSSDKMSMFVSKSGQCLIPEITNKTFPGEDEITVDPNPSSGKFIIRSKNFKQKVIVENSLGVVVYYRELNDVPGYRFSTELDLSSLSAGVYYISVTNYETIDKKSVKKIVIQ